MVRMLGILSLTACCAGAVQRACRTTGKRRWPAGRSRGGLGLNPSDVNTILRQGDTKQTVLKVAEELNADLIVMGSRGLGRLQSILGNSASQYVFQLSTRPMLLVRDDLYVRHVNRVMVGIDGTGVGDDALKLACELARDIPNCVLTGVHISHHDLAPSRSGNNPVDQLLEKAKQRARRYGVELNTLHKTGNISRGLCAAAEEINADLLVIITRSSPLVARDVDLDKLLGDSVSDYVRVHARHLCCWCANWNGREGSALAAVGLDVENDQKQQEPAQTAGWLQSRDRWFAIQTETPGGITVNGRLSADSQLVALWRARGQQRRPRAVDPAHRVATPAQRSPRAPASGLRAGAHAWPARWQRAGSLYRTGGG